MVGGTDASGEFSALHLHLNVYEGVCGCVCGVLRRTVINGVSEEHQAHGHYARCQVVVLQLGLHELLQTFHVQ